MLFHRLRPVWNAPREGARGGRRRAVKGAGCSTDAGRGPPGHEAHRRGPLERLRACVAAANGEILASSRMKPELAGMGTTVVALLAAGDRMALAHVGDSRAYRIRGGAIRRLTDDHTVVGELVRRGEISARAAEAHPHRHVLTRALGVRRAIEPDLLEV